MDQPGIRSLPADPRFRAQAAGLVGAVIAAGTLFLFLFLRWIDGAADLHPAQAQRRLLESFGWAAGGGVAALLVLAAVLWRTAARTRVAGEYPPPGTRVLRDTPVLEGEPALRRARLLRMLAGLAALAGVAVVLLAWRLAPLFSVAPPR